MKVIHREISTLLAAQAQAKAAYERVLAETELQLSSCRSNISAGVVTSGDPLSDLSYLLRGELGGKFETLLRGLQGELAGKTGELFLVVTRTLEAVSSEPVFGTRLNVQKFVGVLGGEQLVFDLKGPAFGIPSSCWRTASLPHVRELTDDNEQGPFWFSRFISVMPALEERGIMVGYGRHQGPKLEILIGDDEVLNSCPVQEEAPSGAEEHLKLRIAVRALGRELPLSSVEQDVRDAILKEGLRQLKDLSEEGFHGDGRRRAVELIVRLREQGFGRDDLVIAYSRVVGV